MKLGHLKGPGKMYFLLFFWLCEILKSYATESENASGLTSFRVKSLFFSGRCLHWKSEHKEFTRKTWPFPKIERIVVSNEVTGKTFSSL